MGSKWLLDPEENVLSHTAIREDVVTLNSQYLTDGVNHEKASDIYVNSYHANEKR
jgi:hypothetical protein